MEDKRFHGKAGEEYNLFKLACPHFKELENTLGNIIREQFQDRNDSEIKVLEIGCGPGFTTLIILDSDERTKIVAVDNEPVMITQAKEILKKFIDISRVQLIEDDALEFLKKQSSDSFDVFASGFTLHNLPNNFRQKVTKEIYRVLKSGGIFVNADKYALDNESKHKKSLEWQLHKFKEKYSQINRPDLIKEWTNHYLEDDKPNVIMRESDSINAMNEMGFKDIKIVFRKQMDAVLFARK
ncbi:class I SAM-dependent methyltransferase [Candidatus Woesearchaeota archaeon]|nr:class I SAM-dependent methyltransferase [Candidatus Woesearchaeota archaeon]